MVTQEGKCTSDFGVNAVRLDLIQIVFSFFRWSGETLEALCKKSQNGAAKNGRGLFEKENQEKLNICSFQFGRIVRKRIVPHIVKWCNKYTKMNLLFRCPWPNFSNVMQ